MKLVSLPFPRRIAAPHDPPSFLPAPPACQSPVTSPHGWIPSLVPFRIPDDAPDTVRPILGQIYRLHKVILKPKPSSTINHLTLDVIFRKYVVYTRVY